MNRSEIVDSLKAFLHQEFPNQGVALTETTDLLGEWFVDSLGIIETVLYLEKNFGIDIKRADINGDNFRNLATLSDFIVKRVGQTTPG
jgi:acyl carrier protein